MMKSDNKINIILTNESFEKGFSKLNKDGIKLSHFPMIKTKPVEQEINLFDIDCVIFTSKNGVKYLLIASLTVLRSFIINLCGSLV